MNRRSYDPELQSALAERIRTSSRPDWGKFVQRWIAFNAIYNTVERSDDGEKGQVKRSVAYLDESTACDLLGRLRNAARELAESPPGDMRYSTESPEFYQSNEGEVKTLSDSDAGCRQRLGALLALVYQVRCNLVHGNKDPSRKRDLHLVRTSNEILEVVLPELEEALTT